MERRMERCKEGQERRTFCMWKWEKSVGMDTEFGAFAVVDRRLCWMWWMRVFEGNVCIAIKPAEIRVPLRGGKWTPAQTFKFLLWEGVCWSDSELYMAWRMIRPCRSYSNSDVTNGAPCVYYVCDTSCRGIISNRRSTNSYAAKLAVSAPTGLPVGYTEWEGGIFFLRLSGGYAVLVTAYKAM